jgi:two-component SAPR family response regulator
MDAISDSTPTTTYRLERRRIERGISGQPIRIHTLGRFGIQIDGRALAPRELRQQKPIELLQCAIALGGRGINKDYLSAALWPDADGDDATNSYDVTLHRLRKLLVHETALIASDSRLTINNETVWVDVWSLEKVLNRIDGCLRFSNDDDGGAQIAHWLNRATGLYQGGFLAREPQKPWGLSLRERLRSKLMRCIINVGRHAESNEQWLNACDCYQTGIELDPLYEHFYQRLMICYRALDRKTEARAVYLRCCANLSSGLQVSPSPATEQLLITL